MRVQCASTTVTKGGSSKVTPDLKDEVYWIFATKSTVGKCHHVLLCNGAKYMSGVAWIRQIRGVGGDLVPQTITDWAKA